MRSRPRWWCAITARRIRSWPTIRQGAPRPRQPVPIEEVVSPAPRKKPQLLPMSTGRTPDVFHGQFSPSSVGLWTFRVDGWGDPHRDVAQERDRQARRGPERKRAVQRPARRRPAAGARRDGRAPPGPLSPASTRRPGCVSPVTRSPAQAPPCRPKWPRCWSSIRCANWSPAASNTASGWTGRWPGSARGTRSSRGPPAAGTPRAIPVHGTFATATKALPRIAKMGFDVVYLPPIHPIGKVHRKGRNNSVTAAPKDVGSPWAIGSDKGGHDAVHPKLGTIEDFDDFVAAARDDGMEVALDLALQCAPDHPWARDHPEWFTVLPDGTIAYAENPPKKYQDIYPMNFDNDPAGHLRGSAAGGPVLDLPRRQGISRRQPAYQAPELLGLADRRGEERGSGRPVPFGGLHPTGAPVRAGQARLHAVLHVLHVAHGEVGAHRIRSSRSPNTPTTPGRTCSSTRPTSCTRACNTAVPACSPSAPCWPRP